MDGLRLIYQIPLFVARLSWKVTIQLFKRDQVRPLRRRLMVAMVQSLGSTFTPEQTKKATPATSAGAQKFCKKHRLPHSTIEILVESGDLKIPPAVLHVVDLNPESAPGSSRRAVLYLHGGGYANPPSPVGQIGMALEMAQAANARYLLILEYGLAPDVAYPGQTLQAVAALQVLCASSSSEVPANVTASGSSAQDFVNQFDGTAIADDLILVGDSAGGHLILSLLAHLKAPSPYAPPIELKRTLRAAVMLSPWVTTSYDSPSYSYNAKSDFLTKESMLYFDGAWKPKKDEVWADPLESAPSKSFWKDIFQGPNRVVDQSIITAGSDEIFLDDIVAFAELTGANEQGSKIQFIQGRGEAHVGYVVDFITGNADGDMRKGTRDFLKQIP